MESINPEYSRGGDAPNNEPASIEDLYNINVVPSELFLKFRKELQGFRLGLNLEFFNFHGNDYRVKTVLKPMTPDRRWKFIYEPTHGDIRLLSKKIPITQFLSLQIRNKTSVGLFPGFDLRIGWRAEYILPEIHGAVGTGEPMFDMNYGRLQASIDRVEAILTHRT